MEPKLEQGTEDLEIMADQMILLIGRKLECLLQKESQASMEKRTKENIS